MSPKPPHIWGPSFWCVLHQTALGYPNVPSAEQRAMYGTFFATLGSVLPCGECAASFREHASDIPLHDFLSSRSTLFEWTVMVHNRVNRALCREEWALSRAWTEHAAPPASCLCTTDRYDSTEPQ